MVSIAHRLTRPVELSAGGGAWRILFTHRVLLDIEELTGLNAMQVNLGQLSARLLRAVLFAVLREAGAPFSLAEAGVLLLPTDVARIRGSLIEAWQASMPEADPDAEQASPGRSEDAVLTTLEAWARARYDLRLSDEEWLSMTPRMAYALFEQRLEHMRWSELMMGIICAHTVNSGFRAPRRPTQPASYMLHPWPERETVQAIHGEDIMRVFADIPKTRLA